MKKIVFVCTGNTCRSPMAAALFNTLVSKDSSLSPYQAISAGINAADNAPATPSAVLALKEYSGIDISTHRSHTLTTPEVNEAFLILTMERWHKDHLMQRIPHAYKKIFTLKEYAYGTTLSTDIKDPFSCSSEIYNKCVEEIAKDVNTLLEKLKKC